MAQARIGRHLQHHGDALAARLLGQGSRDVARQAALQRRQVDAAGPGETDGGFSALLLGRIADRSRPVEHQAGIGAVVAGAGVDRRRSAGRLRRGRGGRGRGGRSGRGRAFGEIDHHRVLGIDESLHAHRLDQRKGRRQPVARDRDALRDLGEWLGQSLHIALDGAVEADQQLVVDDLGGIADGGVPIEHDADEIVMHRGARAGLLGPGRNGNHKTRRGEKGEKAKNQAEARPAAAGVVCAARVAHVSRY